MVGVYIVQNGKFVYVNSRFAGVFGYAPMELINIFPVTKVIHESYRAIADENVKRRMEGEVDGIHYEAMGIKKDGTTNWVEFYGNRVIIGGESTIIGTMIDITDRRLAQELILKEKALSEAVINSLPGIFYLRNEHGKFLRWNKNLEALTGYNAQEIEAHVVRDMIASEDFEVLDKAAAKVFNEGYAMAEAKVKTKDGSKIPFSLTGSPIEYEDQLCLLGTGINISSRVKAEEELRLSEANLQTILNTTDTAYALFDMDLKVLAFNQNAIQFVKGQFDHVPKKGDLLADYFPSNRFPQFINFAGEVLKGNSINYEIDYPQPGGSVRWYYVRLFPITNDSKEILGLMMALSDITERKNAEQDLKSAYERIQNHISSIKDMAWKQSHLIRSPLANLKGLAAMLKDDPADDDVLNFIQNELERMDTTIIEMADDASDHGIND